jgi:transaldolase
MKLFMDTANLDELRFGVDSGLLDGVTTNPTLIAREGKRHHDQLRAICELVDGPVSAEVLATDLTGMVAEGRELAGLAANIVVKIPIGLEGLKAIKALHGEGIKVNTTLIFSPLQAMMAAKAGASYVSPFVGRLDDVGNPGMDVTEQIVEIFDNYEFDCEVLVASVRSPQHVLEAALMGADVATMPHKVFAQMVQHPLTDVGLARFLEDAKKTPR